MKIDAEKSKIYSFSDPMEDLYMCGALNVGKRGYFSDRPDFADCVEGVLEGLYVEAKHDANNYFPFKMECEGVFKYFCPRAYAVEAPELRPYKTPSELPFKVGDSVTLREKDTLKELMLICVGTMINNSQLVLIHLGAWSYEPEDLFEEYELFNGKEWKPFGVEA